ncbi:hypothetical protein DV736_g1915, partial [Chaetothyriales sp. CBS 134916]
MQCKPLLQLLLVSTWTQATSASYSLLQDYSGNAFFEGFDFFTGPDPTAGYVQFQNITSANQTGLAGFIDIGNASQAVFMGVDSTEVAPEGRGAVRVSSRQSFQHALVIADIAHMPGGICGTWPAFWMVGPDWPTNGEIDIVEGVNDQTTNIMTLHTSAGISLSTQSSSKSLAPFAGKIATSNCDVNAPDQAKNAGCSIVDNSNLTFGAGFNAAGGGVYATEWTSQFIKIWFFPRDSIPSDITSGRPQPQASWGKPRSLFQDGPNLDDHFKNLQIVFDNTFCGDWAGEVWNETQSCMALAPTCEEYVTNNPQAFAEAYWAVNTLQVFQDNEALNGTSSSTASTKRALRPDSRDGAAVAGGTFPASSRVHVADLQHERGAVSDQYIEASVSLVWPYSSSTRKFSLLLAESDARAGIARQQVKVIFYNGAAKAAQASHVGIGDTIRLSLDGCTWERIQDEVSTPGKRLDFDIEFTRSLKLEVNPGHDSDRTVNYQWHASPSPELPTSVHSVIDLSGRIACRPTELPIQFSSPGSRKSLRMSSCSFVEASLDPFAEDKDYVYGRNRKRTRFARESGSWRLLDDGDDEVGDDEPEAVESACTPAPPRRPTPLEEVEAALQLSHIPPESIRLTSPTEVCQDQQEQPTSRQITQLDSRPEDLMPPPQRPIQALPEEARHITLLESAAEDVVTPRLHPLPSPGLPLVSPLVSGFGADGGFFFSGVATVSELDVTGTSAHSHTDSVASSVLGEPFPVEAVPVPQDDSQTTADLQTTQTEIFNAAEHQESHITSPQPPGWPPAEARGTKPATNVLDVLEAFLQMSPTASEPVQMLQPSTPPLSTTEGSEQNEEANGHTASATSVASIDGAYDSDKLISPAEPRSSWENIESSKSDQHLEGGKKSVEIGRQSASAALADESEFRREGQSATLVVDAELESQITANEHLIAARDNRLTSDTTIVNHIPHENCHYLPTPAQTQEQEVNVIEDLPIEIPRPNTHSQLPTPEQTQVGIKTPVDIVGEVADLVAEQAETTDVIENIVSINRRRLTQEVSRLSEVSKHLSSPYFTSKRPPTPDGVMKSPTSPSFKESRTDHGQSVGLTTSIAYYTPLTFLHEHFNQLVDIIAICASDSVPPEQATRGPKEWHTSLRIADPSCDAKAGSGSVVQLFRYEKDAVPSTKRGDAVILRDFKVETRKHEAVLLSTNSSSWAVFDGSLDERSMVEEPVVSGPPLEYGRGETAYVRKMVRWWADEGHDLFPDKWDNKTDDATVEHVDHTERNVNYTPRSRRQQQKLSIHEHPGEGQEDAVQSIEEAPKSPVRTRRQAQMAEEVNDGGRIQIDEGQKRIEKDKQTSATPGKATTPSRRRLSRGTKTPSANTGVNIMSSSPQQPSSQRSQGRPQTRQSARSTKSPSLVHELRDGKEYVDGSPRKKRSKEDVHELRNGTKYADGE